MLKQWRWYVYIVRCKDVWGIFNLMKGGCGKIFKKGELVYSDSGAIARLKDGRLAVSAIIDPASDIEVTASGFNLKKNLMIYHQNYATPFIFLIFRKFLFFFGPFAWSSRFLRAYLQKKMILGKNKIDAVLKRSVNIQNNHVEIETIIGNAEDVQEASLSTDLVPLYMAVSECFQKNMLKVSWRKLSRNGEKLALREIIQ